MIRRLFHVAFGILIIIVVVVTGIIWYVVASQKNLDLTQTYFTCYGLPDVRHTLAEAGSPVIDYVNADGSVYDDQGLESACHEAYVGGSTQPQSVLSQELEAQMDTFSNGKNYEVHLTYTTSAHIELFLMVYFLEYFAFLIIARTFKYIVRGS